MVGKEVKIRVNLVLPACFFVKITDDDFGKRTMRLILEKSFSDEQVENHCLRMTALEKTADDGENV